MKKKAAAEQPDEISIDELLRRILQQEADKVCTANIKERIWKSLQEELEALEEAAGKNKGQD